MTLRTRNSAAYKGVYALLMRDPYLNRAECGPQVQAAAGQAGQEGLKDQHEVVERRPRDGTRHRLIKVAVDLADLTRRLSRRGWQATATSSSHWLVGRHGRCRTRVRGSARQVPTAA